MCFGRFLSSLKILEMAWDEKFSQYVLRRGADATCRNHWSLGGAVGRDGAKAQDGGDPQEGGDLAPPYITVATQF